MRRDEFVIVRPRTGSAQRGDILDETIEALRLLPMAQRCVK